MQFIFTLGQYIALIAAMGIPVYGIRVIARARHSQQQLSHAFFELVIINFITSLLYSIIYLFVVVYNPFFHQDSAMFLYSGISILLSFTSIDWFYSGLEAFKLIAIRSIIIKIITFILILLFVTNANATEPYLLICIFSVVANNIVNIWTVRKYIGLSIKGINIIKHLRPLFFIFGTTIASTLYTTFDGIILGFLSGNRAVGLYTAATKVVKISLPVIMAYGAILIPDITNSIQDGNNAKLEDNLNRSYAYITMLSVPVCIGLFVFAPACLSIFSGKDFLEAVITMRILSFLPFLIGLGYFWGYQVILPYEKDRFLMYSALVGMLLSLALNFLLVPHMKENGTAIANVISEFAVTLSYFLLIRKHLTISLKHYYIFQSFAAAAPFFIFMFISNHYLFGNVFATVVVNIAICALVYFIIQLFIFKNDVMLSLVNQYKKKNEPY